jgi:SAM-dependent methyltransferase
MNEETSSSSSLRGKNKTNTQDDENHEKSSLSIMLTKIMHHLLLGSERATLEDTATLSERSKISNGYFDEVFRKYPTKDMKAVAAKERNEKKLKGTSFVYGELRFVPFACTIEKIKEELPEEGGIFVDLGSGSGKACFAAALLHPFTKVIGIEIMEDLTEKARTILREDWNPPSSLLWNRRSKNKTAEIQFIREDVTKIQWWKQCDVAFANSTCFDRKLMRTISRQSENMKKGSFFITFTKELCSDQWEVINSKRYNMSWGAATVFIHRKV